MWSTSDVDRHSSVFTNIYILDEVWEIFCEKKGVIRFLLNFQDRIFGFCGCSLENTNVDSGEYSGGGG